MKFPLKTLGRWIAVLPGAILTGLLATFPLHWILIFWVFPDNGKYVLDLVELVNRVNVMAVELDLTPFIIAIFYISIGAEIAPRYKFATASVLSVLYVCTMVYIYLSADGQANFGVRTSFALLGVFSGLLIVWCRHNKGKLLRRTVN